MVNGGINHPESRCRREALVSQFFLISSFDHLLCAAMIELRIVTMWDIMEH